MNNMNNYQNRNFAGQMPNTGFQGNAMAGFQGQMPGMQFGNFQNRNGMMGGMRGGARGGRGGMNMMGGMQMGGMGMNMAGMPNQMAMNPMAMGAMGMQGRQSISYSDTPGISSRLSSPYLPDPSALAHYANLAIPGKTAFLALSLLIACFIDIFYSPGRHRTSLLKWANLCQLIKLIY